MRFGWCQANTANTVITPNASHGCALACPETGVCLVVVKVAM